MRSHMALENIRLTKMATSSDIEVYKKKKKEKKEEMKNKKKTMQKGK